MGVSRQLAVGGAADTGLGQGELPARASDTGLGQGELPASCGRGFRYWVGPG